MKTHSLLLAAFLVLPTISSGQTISTGVPGFISYQGRVLDSAGALVGTGTPVNRTVIFRVWDHPTNTGTANLIYSEEQTVTISEGEFSVLVGQGVATSSNQFLYSETSKGPPASIADAFNGSARYLGVTVEDGTAAVDNEITPRQQVVTSAFAFRSKYAETLGTSTSTALTVLDSGNIGLGNTNPPALFTISGANTSLSTSTPQFVVTADDVSERLRVGVDSTGNGTSFLQSYKEGTGATNLLLNPNGGNVGIGTASPSTPLYVLTNSTAVAGDSGLTIEQAGTGDAALSLLITGQIRYNIGIDNSDGDKLKIFSDSLNAFGGSGITMDVSGRVGIGNTAPGAQLQVGSPSYGFASPTFQVGGGALGGTVGDTKVLGSFNINPAGGNNSSLAIKAKKVTSELGWGGTALGITYDVDGVGPSGGQIWMYNGKVGIGAETPSGKLHVKDTMLDVYTSVGTAPEGGWARDGLTVASNPGAGFSTMVIASAHDAVTDRGILDVTRTGISQFYVRADGNVGIATSTPTQAKLVVNGSVTSQPHGGTYGYLSATGAVGNGTSAAQATSIYATNTIWAGTFVISSSDERIKLIQGRSDGMKDLTTLQGLEITDYQYKDVIAKGDGLQKKLIAQQVEKVFPQAVSKRTDTVPDIYRKASLKEGWIALTTDLKKGERVRLIGEDHDAIHEVTEVAKAGFRTDYRPDLGTDKPAKANNTGKNVAGEIFVFGREVDDFRTVDYDAISMLNVSATQELARKVERLEAQNAEKDETLAAMTKRLAALEAEDKARNAKLAAIEKLLRGADKPAVRTVSLKSAE